MTMDKCKDLERSEVVLIQVTSQKSIVCFDLGVGRVETRRLRSKNWKLR
jgi:hypothetical protein